jgi:hypothetical protein
MKVGNDCSFLSVIIPKMFMVLTVERVYPSKNIPCNTGVSSVVYSSGRFSWIFLATLHVNVASNLYSVGRKGSLTAPSHLLLLKYRLP